MLPIGGVIGNIHPPKTQGLVLNGHLFINLTSPPPPFFNQFMHQSTSLFFFLLNLSLNSFSQISVNHFYLYFFYFNNIIMDHIQRFLGKKSHTCRHKESTLSMSYNSESDTLTAQLSRQNTAKAISSSQLNENEVCYKFFYV